MKFAIHDRVRSSVHGPGTVVNLQYGYVGVHLDSARRDSMTTRWYRDFGDGRYTASMGTDVLTPADASMTALQTSPPEGELK